MKTYEIWTLSIYTWMAHGISYDKVDGLYRVGEVKANGIKEAFEKAKAQGFPAPILTEKDDDTKVDEAKNSALYGGRAAWRMRA